MHIHAQTQVELDRTVAHVSSGSDQHAAITTSITNLNPPSSKCGAIGMGIMSPSRLCLELSIWGSRALRVHVWSYRDARAASQSGQGGQSGQPERPGRPDRPARAARSGQPERPGRPARAARAARAASQSGQSSQPGRSGRPDRPARAARSGQGRPARAARAAGAASQSGQGGQSGLRRRIWAKMCIFPRCLLCLVDQSVKGGSERKGDP
mgnify:CR=1 FL=1